MNTGSQSTATYNDFTTVDTPCAIPTHTIEPSPGHDWKVFAFRNTATSLYSFVTEVIEKNALETTLQNNIYALQEYFLERLYAIFLQQDIDVTEKISLSLNAEKGLYLCNEHTDKEKIKTVLDQTSELTVLFKEMALQSLALSQITSLQELTYHYLTNQQTAIPQASLYAVNIKREMSHFFFASQKE